MSDVLPDSVEVIRGLLMKAFGESGQIKEFYNGDPDLIPAFNLPAITVSKLHDDSESGTNAQDDVTESILVKVIVDKRPDWQDVVDPENLSETKLRRLVEARGAEDGKWLPNTVKGALRNGLPMDSGMTIGERMSLDIGTSSRGDDLPTNEAHLTVEVTNTVDVL